MIRDSLAVVLRVLPRGEDDLLCDLFTVEKGRVWGLARSGRKSRRRFGTTLAPLNILRIFFDEKREFSLLFLREASVAIPLSHLQQDLGRLGTAFYLVEAIRELTPERSFEPKKFNLLSESLQALNRGEEPSRVKEEFERNLLQISGLLPHLSGCLRCGVQQEQYSFVIREGGLFCDRCIPAGSPFERVAATDLSRLFTPFLEYCIGKQLRSKGLL